MKTDLLYEGKAKQIYQTDKPNEIVMVYKNDATAFNGVKKASIEDKGLLNNQISTYIFNELNKVGVETHLIETLSPTEQLCQKVDVIPLEFICRNEVYGSMAKRLGMKPGTKVAKPIYEICYKEDELNDPLIIDAHAYALGVINEEDLKYCYELLAKINEELARIFLSLNIRLIDFKVEFGRNQAGEIILCDEISPDSCRLFDVDTNEQLDKDLFRHDLGDLTSAYREILKRIEEQNA